MSELALVQVGPYGESAVLTDVKAEMAAAVAAVVWPLDAQDFRIRPVRKGNGVTAIRRQFQQRLAALYPDTWDIEWQSPIGVTDAEAGAIDAVRRTEHGLHGVEWETGNISSSHRSLNKLALGIIQGHLVGGTLVLPTRALYPYLTDRTGNLEELSPYFPLWRHLVTGNGYLSVIAVQHDATDADVPLLPKGTDGRAREGARNAARKAEEREAKAVAKEAARAARALLPPAPRKRGR